MPRTSCPVQLQHRQVGRQCRITCHFGLAFSAVLPSEPAASWPWLQLVQRPRIIACSGLLRNSLRDVRGWPLAACRYRDVLPQLHEISTLAGLQTLLAALHQDGTLRRLAVWAVASSRGTPVGPRQKQHRQRHPAQQQGQWTLCARKHSWQPSSSPAAAALAARGRGWVLQRGLGLPKRPRTRARGGTPSAGYSLAQHRSSSSRPLPHRIRCRCSPSSRSRRARGGSSRQRLLLQALRRRSPGQGQQ